MGTLDEIRRDFGDDFFTRPTAAAAARHNWAALCVCGHQAGYHSPTVGGTYRLPETASMQLRGETWTTVHLFHGCVGALPTRGTETESSVANRDSMTVTRSIIPTCPCEELRPVANVDRPNRYFNQRMPADRNDRGRHPFMLGIRAFTTHLTRRRAALADPSWPAAEFDRRFTWIDGARVCGISKCKETDDVWPMFVDVDGRSELRCPKHR